jgi:co-chaperonin GroES (HSP10)|tara:strand:+ start:175 stop:432 length:258 start_codon:yes stop_codon:yes gene_type:complete
MRAINNYIVIKKIKDQEKKVAGLILTEQTDTDNRYARAEIISVGNLIQGLQEGNIIHYDKFAGHGISWKEKLYHVITDRDVIVVE